MIGLILIFYLGKQFYTLAETYSKNKWVFAILGVISYYFGTILFGVLLGLWVAVIGNEEILEYSDFVLGLMGIPFGLLSTWGFYSFLKKYWSKTKSSYSDFEILDDGI